MMSIEQKTEPLEVEICPTKNNWFGVFYKDRSGFPALLEDYPNENLAIAFCKRHGLKIKNGIPKVDWKLPLDESIDPIEDQYTP